MSEGFTVSGLNDLLTLRFALGGHAGTNKVLGSGTATANLLFDLTDILSVLISPLSSMVDINVHNEVEASVNVFGFKLVLAHGLAAFQETYGYKVTLMPKLVRTVEQIGSGIEALLNFPKKFRAIVTSVNAAVNVIVNAHFRIPSPLDILSRLGDMLNRIKNMALTFAKEELTHLVQDPQDDSEDDINAFDREDLPPDFRPDDPDSLPDNARQIAAPALRRILRLFRSAIREILAAIGFDNVVDIASSASCFVTDNLAKVNDLKRAIDHITGNVTAIPNFLKEELETAIVSVLTCPKNALATIKQVVADIQAKVVAIEHVVESIPEILLRDICPETQSGSIQIRTSRALSNGTHVRSAGTKCNPDTLQAALLPSCCALSATAQLDKEVLACARTKSAAAKELVPLESILLSDDCKTLTAADLKAGAVNAYATRTILQVKSASSGKYYLHQSAVRSLRQASREYMRASNANCQLSPCSFAFTDYLTPTVSSTAPALYYNEEGYVRAPGVSHGSTTVLITP